MQICISANNNIKEVNYEIVWFMKNKKYVTADYDDYVNLILPEDFEGNDIPYMLEHINGKVLYREYMEDCDDDYYLYIMKHGEKERKLRESREYDSRNNCFKK